MINPQPKPFAFYGRVSTEDNQDPESSRTTRKRKRCTLKLISARTVGLWVVSEGGFGHMFQAHLLETGMHATTVWVRRRIGQAARPNRRPWMPARSCE